MTSRFRRSRLAAVHFILLAVFLSMSLISAGTWGARLAAAEPDNTGNAAQSTVQTEDLIETLLQQGVSSGQIWGIDADGIPLVSGTPIDGKATKLSTLQMAADGLPTGTRGWEVIPNVIRDDGIETFRVEVDVNDSVASVKMDIVSDSLVPPAVPPFELRDDGLGDDRVAGDFVFTSGTFRYNTSTSVPFPDFYENDPTSPAGLSIIPVASTLEIEELDGTITQFLIPPAVGMLRSDITETTTVTMSPDIIVSPHLINIRSSTRETQRFLRFLGGNLSSLTNSIYQVLPDAFDFFIFFSTNKIEQLPFTESSNFNAGVHSSVQVNYTGTGLGLFDNTAVYGSNGQLLSVNVIDTYDRGIHSNNATHELVHQWASFTSPTLVGLSDGTGHYGVYCPKPRKVR